MTSLAWPIRQSMVGKGSAGLVDPFYATRVVLLAKSSTIAGALFLGAALGAGVFFFSRPVVAEVSLWLTLVALGGAIVLMAGGALAERWCTLPPDSSEPGAPVVPEGDVG